ncbi:helix-turn-helix transcriptional regulator [Lysinibacillus mangiferihumi]|uniref:Helix-turn-helix transcriptional regulator n=1 Tax=Lysinibacillus mangiferihumi TaxID=1130819 RepID=A0A4U2Z339_9BACI|nr:helix-turn-helix transcriptional regulator [Lysinibacillus mangiferihumi]TKI68095.1 helix-turn-helix transcriptional regulator [Lysinibacillus mangiferihumi]
MKREKVENNVRNIRRALDLTQEELAKRIGVHRQTIIAIEKQKYEPTIGVALALATVLNQPVEKIFFFTWAK